MLNNEWKVIKGYSNMGDDTDTIVARKGDDGKVFIGYMAYGGVKLVELVGIDDVAEVEESGDVFSEIISECGDDWEVAIPVKISEVSAIVVIDSNSSTSLIKKDGVADVERPSVDFSVEYEAEELDELMEEDEELLRALDLA